MKMRTAPHTRLSLRLPRQLAVALVAGCLLPGTRAMAHGTMVVPESRVYKCFLDNPENPSDPACAAAKDVAGSQAFYDWNSIRQGNAAGDHQTVVPDGQLCSGGGAEFAGLDLARPDWQATPIAPKADGTFDFEFYATAPHATQEWIFYVTRQGYSGDTPLKWSDLFEFCRLGNVALGADNHYTLNCPLPSVTGKHVIYTVWQRADSPEAFYTCTDVVLGDGTSSPWADEGALNAQSDLVAGSTVTLRLFNSGGNDVESLPYSLAADMTAAEWAYAFAQYVNSQSQYARIGVLDPDSGAITPVQSASANRVFTQADMDLSHQVEFDIPAGNSAPVAVVAADPAALTGAGSVSLSAAGSSDPDGDALTYSWSITAGTGASLSSTSGANVTLSLAEPTADQTVTVSLSVSDGELGDAASVDINHSASGDTGGGSGGNYDYAYPDGIGSYVPGETVVLGSDGNRYQCRPWPYGDWCNIDSAYHYAPGSGVNWQDAWTQL
ncbi:lytic polysaccharide monooxygenase [Microbulbifer sp. SAOS-129_SWC]|uniref:lytic polysaccharide monooxygenase n=1 Tax=Microbulbifer sp. SAOS-129_SWC TaxID=3145235 RepID=UPI00321762EC